MNLKQIHEQEVKVLLNASMHIFKCWKILKHRAKLNITHFRISTGEDWDWEKIKGAIPYMAWRANVIRCNARSKCCFLFLKNALFVNTLVGFCQAEKANKIHSNASSLSTATTEQSSFLFVHKKKRSWILLFFN